MPFKKVGVSLSGSWYAVEDVDGAVLWIHKNLVTGNMRCAVINADEVNVRTGPGMQYKGLFSGPVEKYSSFRVLNRKGSWVRLRDAENIIGWAHRDDLWIQ
jgi:SH3-like domain-containing protein